MDSESQEPQLKINDFCVFLRKKLGQGGYGIVYKGKNTKSGATIAAKQIDIGSDEALVIKAKQEGENMLICEHRNILKIFGIEKTEKSIWLFMEFCDKRDLIEFYQENSISEEMLLHLCSCITKGIAYLHSKALIHRDLKPGNVLISTAPGKGDRPIAKIADFGVSKVIQDCSGIDQLTRMNFTTHKIGTGAYMAPELHDVNEQCDHKVDIFAMGLTFFAMVCHQPDQRFLRPYDPRCGEGDDPLPEALGEEIQIMKDFELTTEDIEIFIDKFVPPVDETSAVKTNLRGLIKKMVQLKPSTRPRAAAVDDAIDAMVEKPKARPRDSTTSSSSDDEQRLNEDEEIVEYLSTESAISADDAEAKVSKNNHTKEEDDVVQKLIKNALHKHKQNARKSQNIEVGDLMRISSRCTPEELKESLQEFGVVKPEMRKHIGKHGKVVKVTSNRIDVLFDDEQIPFNPTWKYFSRVCFATSGDFKKHSIVEVWPTLDEIRKLQRGKDFSKNIAAYIGARGMVHVVHADGDVLVESVLGVNGMHEKFFYNPKALKVIDESSEKIGVGDLVLVKEASNPAAYKKEKQLYGRVANVKAIEDDCFVLEKHGKTHIFKREDLIRLCSEQDHEVHWHVQCDFCGNHPISGIRHKCKICPDFDLCDRCLKSRPHGHPADHEFREFLKSVHQKSLDEKTHITVTQDDEEILEELRKKLGEYQRFLPREKSVEVKVGDMVFVNPNLEQVKKWQVEVGSNFVDPMEKCLGKPGIVTKIVSNRLSLAKVKVETREFTYSGRALTKLLSKDDLSKLKSQLTTEKSGIAIASV